MWQLNIQKKTSMKLEWIYLKLLPTIGPTKWNFKFYCCVFVINMTFKQFSSKASQWFISSYSCWRMITKTFSHNYKGPKRITNAQGMVTEIQRGSQTYWIIVIKVRVIPQRSKENKASVWKGSLYHHRRGAKWFSNVYKVAT